MPAVVPRRPHSAVSFVGFLWGSRVDPHLRGFVGPPRRPRRAADLGQPFGADLATRYADPGRQR
jgi:hypothetical protein